MYNFTLACSGPLLSGIFLALIFCTELLILSLRESYITTDGQSASLSWNKTPIGCSRPDFYCCQTVAGLLIWGALYDERTGLSFTSAVILLKYFFSHC
jgi:hypothetical protein